MTLYVYTCSCGARRESTKALLACSCGKPWTMYAAEDEELAAEQLTLWEDTDGR